MLSNPDPILIGTTRIDAGRTRSGTTSQPRAACGITKGEERSLSMVTGDPFTFKSPKKLNPPLPYSLLYPRLRRHHHRPPPSNVGERRIRAFPDNFESRSELWFPRGWAAAAIAAKRVFSLPCLPLRRRGATIARRRDYPSFAGQRIFSSWAPPLHEGVAG